MSIASLVPGATVHSVTSLRYRLYSGLVDLSPLVIRQVRHVAWGQARVSAYVLGASHALTVAFPDGKTFTELLTCLPPQDGSAKASESAREWPVPSNVGRKWESQFTEAGLQGTVRLWHVALTPDIDDFSCPFSPENTLHEAFPLPTGETAWTRVAWRIEVQRLFLETIHTYPEDRAGIRSTTCLWFPRSK